MTIESVENYYQIFLYFSTGLFFIYALFVEYYYKKKSSSETIILYSDLDKYIHKNKYYKNKIKDILESVDENVDKNLNKESDQKVNISYYTFLMESTPLGIVIMHYDETANSFLYYSNKQVPFRLLESICQKFVVTFCIESLYTEMDCKSEVVNRQKKLPKQYARFKEKKELKEKITKKMNNYTYKGQVKDFNFLKKDKTTSDYCKLIRINDLSYQDFLKNK